MLTNMTRITLAGAVALAMAGCGTVGPDFVAPRNIDGAAFRHQAAAGAAEAPLPADWWTVFGDATLNRLEQTALAANPGVKAAAQRLLQARAQAGTARASQAPSVNLGAQAANMRSSASTAEGLALGGESIHGNDYEVNASLSYEVDLWGQVRRMVESADAQVVVADAERDGVLLMLAGQVAQTYWQLRGLDAEAVILRRALDSRRETEGLVNARFDAGLTNELDVARARVESANAESELHDVARQRYQLEHSLATLLGASPSGSVLAAAGGASTLPAPPAIPVGLPASLLAHRPDLIVSVAGLRAANARVGVADGAFYPSLQLTGYFGYASESLRDLARGGSRQFSFGPLRLSLPIFDGGRNRANLADAQARYDEALANHEGKLLNALREVEDALSDLQQRQRQGQALAQSQQAAQRAYQVALARYARGVSTYLDVTDAQRSALAAERAAAQIATQRLLATVAVARALGAGWQGDANGIGRARPQRPVPSPSAS